MRTGSLSLLLATLLFTAGLYAEEETTATAPVAPVAAPSVSTPAPAAVEEPPSVPREEVVQPGEQGSAQLSRLRQENQRLKLQLKQAQSQQPPRLLSEQQMWFAIGAGTTLLAFLIGMFSGGRRNKRQSQWA